MSSFRFISIVQINIRKVLVVFLLTNTMIHLINQQRKLSSGINVMYAMETFSIHWKSTMMLFTVE